MNSQQQILALTAHLTNLEQANDFDHWKAAHLRFVQMLIDHFKAECAKEEVLTKFVAETEQMLDNLETTHHE